MISSLVPIFRYSRLTASFCWAKRKILLVSTKGGDHFGDISGHCINSSLQPWGCLSAEPLQSPKKSFKSRSFSFSHWKVLVLTLLDQNYGLLFLEVVLVLELPLVFINLYDLDVTKV